MKSKRYPILILLICLVLWGCAENRMGEDSAHDTTYGQNTEVMIPVTVEETTEATMETTLPLHAAFYHPDYTTDQIWEYFEEVILHVEYSSGTGDSALVQKWLNPIRYRVFGSPTEEDLTVLSDFFGELNRIPGFPGILEAAEGETEQLRLSFLDSEAFRASYSSVVGGEDATGATEFWYYTDSNEIHSARIGYRTDVDQSIRNSVLIEEIVNTLGISDTVLREDSVTYQYSDFNTSLSDVDRILLNLLYHPRILCGMDAEACAQVLRQIYY